MGTNRDNITDDTEAMPREAASNASEQRSTVSANDQSNRVALYNTGCCVELDAKKFFEHRPQAKHFSNCYTYSSSLFQQGEELAPTPAMPLQLPIAKSDTFPKNRVHRALITYEVEHPHDVVRATLCTL